MNGAKVALAVIAGYYLGRHHKLRLAAMLALLILAARLRGGGAAGLVQQGAKILGGASPELGKITERLRGDLLEIGKAAAMSAAGKQIDSLSDKLHERAEALRHPKPPQPAQEAARQAADRAQEAAREAADRAQEAAREAADRAHEATEEVRRRAARPFGRRPPAEPPANEETYPEEELHSEEEPYPEDAAHQEQPHAEPEPEEEQPYAEPEPEERPRRQPQRPARPVIRRR